MDTLPVSDIFAPLRERIFSRVTYYGISLQFSHDRGLAWVAKSHVHSLMASLWEQRRAVVVVVLVKSREGMLSLKMDKLTARKLYRQLEAIE
jgi:hypothetical protein